MEEMLNTEEIVDLPDVTSYDALYIREGNIMVKNQIVIERDGLCYYCPHHDMLLEEGWVLYEPEVTLEMMINDKINDIITYDKSSNVNEFYVYNVSMWLSREERIVIKDRFEREVAQGITKTKLRYNGLSLELDPVIGIQMINALSSYADACFDVTEDHKANVKELKTKEEVESYDYTIGYPDKLTFEL